MCAICLILFWAFSENQHFKEPSAGRKVAVRRGWSRSTSPAVIATMVSALYPSTQETKQRSGVRAVPPTVGLAVQKNACVPSPRDGTVSVSSHLQQNLVLFSCLFLVDWPLLKTQTTTPRLSSHTNVVVHVPRSAERQQATFQVPMVGTVVWKTPLRSSLRICCSEKKFVGDPGMCRVIGVSSHTTHVP